MMNFNSLDAYKFIQKTGFLKIGDHLYTVSIKYFPSTSYSKKKADNLGSSCWSNI